MEMTEMEMEMEVEMEMEMEKVMSCDSWGHSR